MDWRTSELQTGVAPTDHANLSGLVSSSEEGNYKHISDVEPLQLPTFTTTERDVFTPKLGMTIANSTTNTTQKYSNGSWSDF